MTEITPFLLYLIGVLTVVVGALAVSALLGERGRRQETGAPYESGVSVTGSARPRVTAPFYLVGMLFVIFDLEVAFLFSWAVALRDLGWTGYFGAGFFLIVLVVGLVYEWREGALDWGPRRKHASRALSAARAVREQPWQPSRTF